MGYSYSRNANGRMVLDCDGCGENPARKVRCPFTVSYADGGTLPYCQAPALCAKCRGDHGTKAAHRANGCETGAAKAQAREADRAAKALTGVLVTIAAWGSWHETVPNGFVGVAATPGGLRQAGQTAAYYLVPQDEYRARSDGYVIREGLDAWTGPEGGAITKQIAI